MALVGDSLGMLIQGHACTVPVALDQLACYLQFAPHEDFDTCPRTFERDAELLRVAGCDLFFAPDEAQL